MSMGYWHVCVLQLTPFYAAGQILGHFRDRFIEDVDPNAIVDQLKCQNILSNDDARWIRTHVDQNVILHGCLRQKCTKEALMTVCEVFIAVRGNPKMRALGADMKNMLEGKCCQWLFFCDCCQYVDSSVTKCSYL